MSNFITRFKEQLPEQELLLQDFTDYSLIVTNKIDLFIDAVKQIGPITDDSKRNLLNDEVLAMKKIVKNFKQKRLDATKILDSVKSEAIAWENQILFDPMLAIDNTSKILIAYDTEKELQRRQEAEKKQAELVEQQATANKRLNDIAILNGVLQKGGDLLASIHITNDANAFTICSEKYKNFLTWADKNSNFIIHYEFTEQMKELSTNLKEALTLCEQRVLQYANADAKQKKAIEKQNQEAAGKAAIAAEQALKDQLIAMAKEEDARFQEQENKIKELDALKSKRLKFLNLGFDFQIVNMEDIPDEFIKKELKLKEAKAFVKNGGVIPGVSIVLKDGTVLDEKEYAIIHKK
jgi:hypothetical protein